MNRPDGFSSAVGDRRGTGQPTGPDRYPPGALRADILAACMARPWWPSDAERDPELVHADLRWLAVAEDPAGQPVLLGKANTLANAIGVFGEFTARGFTPWLLVNLDADCAEEAVLDCPAPPAELTPDALEHTGRLGLDRLP